MHNLRRLILDERAEDSDEDIVLPKKERADDSSDTMDDATK